jgi:hypothetical protein
MVRMLVQVRIGPSFHPLLIGASFHRQAYTSQCLLFPRSFPHFRWLFSFTLLISSLLFTSSKCAHPSYSSSPVGPLETYDYSHRTTTIGLQPSLSKPSCLRSFSPDLSKSYLFSWSPVVYSSFFFTFWPPGDIGLQPHLSKSSLFSWSPIVHSSLV